MSSTWRKGGCLLAGLLVLGIGGWLALQPKKTEPSRKGGAPVAVSVVTVEKQNVPLELTALGSASATHTVVVRSRVDGQLDKLHFEEGQSVRQGQLLAELDPRPFLAALTQAEGQLQRDQAQLKNAEIDLARYRQLLALNSIAAQQVDTQQALVHQYQGTVQLDQGLLANARLQLSYSKISAPASGRLGLRQIDPGNMIHSSDSNGLVVITQTQPVNVIFALPEAGLSQVLQASSGQPPLKVTVFDQENRKQLAEGVLLAIDNQLNASTGTVNLKAQFANKDQQLFPNQFVNVHLQLGIRADALTIPTAAIQTGKAGAYVYIVGADQSVSMRPVTTGPVSNDLTIIGQGLHPGQKVVIDGLDKLRDGAKVRVIERSTTTDNTTGSNRHGRHASAPRSE